MQNAAKHVIPQSADKIGNKQNVNYQQNKLFKSKKLKVILNLIGFHESKNLS